MKPLQDSKGEGPRAGRRRKRESGVISKKQKRESEGNIKIKRIKEKREIKNENKGKNSENNLDAVFCLSRKRRL